MEYAFGRQEAGATLSLKPAGLDYTDSTSTNKQNPKAPNNKKATYLLMVATTVTVNQVTVRGYSLTPR